MNIKFTILTVVKNDKKNRKNNQKCSRAIFKNFEYIVIDGNSDDGTL